MIQCCCEWFSCDWFRNCWLNVHFQVWQMWNDVIVCDRILCFFDHLSMLVDPTCLILFNSFSPTGLAIRSLHVFAYIGSGAVPGQLPGAGSGRFRGRFREGSGAGSEPRFREGSGASSESRVPRKVPGQVPNDRFRSRTVFPGSSGGSGAGSEQQVPGRFRTTFRTTGPRKVSGRFRFNEFREVSGAGSEPRVSGQVFGGPGFRRGRFQNGSGQVSSL